ncbi:MAG: AAA family ATPase [Parcubacteria group bacterium]|nr:AAA family ATPase [Parcubacteria group bacterium]
MRITILGLPGSGKTTLAEKIAEKKQIPHIHIDRFWLENGGGVNSQTTPNPEQTHARVREKVLEAIQKESWVSDGFYSRIQPEIAERADIVIFLNIPLWRRMLNHTWRVINRSKRHEEVTFWRDLAFFLEMIGRESTKTLKINNFLKLYRSKTVILRSRREIDQYVANL